MINFNDQNVLRALKRLSANTDFNILLDHLKSELTSLDAKNRQMDGTNLYRGQGHALCIDAILQAVVSAHLNRGTE